MCIRDSPGTHRIIAINDELLATRLEHGGTLAVPAHALLHVVAFGADGIVRDDAVWLGALAHPTGGIAVRAGGDQPLDATVLARPIALEHVAITTPGWTELDPDRPNRCIGADT